VASVRTQTGEGLPIMVNSAAKIVNGAAGANDTLHITLKAAVPGTGYTSIAPMPEPREVNGAGARAADSAALQRVETGWLYDAGLKAVVLKHRFTDTEVAVEVIP